MSGAILFKSGATAQVARLYAVKLWRDAVAPGAAVEYLHNIAYTQTLVVFGYPAGYLHSMTAGRPSKLLDLHDLQKYLPNNIFESIDLEKDATFKAVFAKYLEKEGSSLRPKY